MSMTAADWMELSYYKMRNHNTHDPDCRMIVMSNQVVRPWAVCADGTIISIQGSPFHYSKPKEFTPKYISVEVGLLHSDPSLDEAYFSHIYSGLGVRYVYGNVAMDDVERFVSEHGGIVNT